MTANVQCVVHAMTPTNILAALCAVETVYPKQLAGLNLTLVTHYPGGSDSLAAEFAAVARAITGTFTYVRHVVSLPQSLYDQLERSPGAALPSAQALRKLIGVERADAWFYAHDLSGDLVPALASAYPASTCICFGDALGQVFQKDVHLGFLSRSTAIDSVETHQRGTIKSLARALWAKVAISRARSGRATISGSIVPDRAVLILPVDQSGDFLPRTRLTVCPKPIVARIMEKTSAACDALSGHIDDVLARTAGRNRCLLLTENWAESKTIDFDQEIRLYCDMIERNFLPGSVVLVKTHPGEELSRASRLADLLGDKYDFISLDDGLRRYPIELWPKLVRSCRVVSTMYPCLSLKFLYDVDVLQVMSDAFVERWFPPWTWASYKNALELNMQPLARLPRWNGKSVLWSGSH